MQEWLKITRAPCESTEEKTDNIRVGGPSVGQRVLTQDEDPEPTDNSRTESVVLEWSQRQSKNVEVKDGNDVTKLYEDAGETLSAIAISLAFTKSLEISQKFSFPLIYVLD